MYRKLFIAALGVALLADISAASAATQAGDPKLRPAHGYMAEPAAVERFKDRQEVAYENNTPAYTQETRVIEGHAYGDQVNKIPAKERFYDYGRNGYADEMQPDVKYRTR